MYWAWFLSFWVVLVLVLLLVTSFGMLTWFNGGIVFFILFGIGLLLTDSWFYSSSIILSFGIVFLIVSFGMWVSPRGRKPRTDYGV